MQDCNSVEWRDIPGYTGYKISLHGVVFDVLKNRIVKSRVHGTGYIIVGMRTHGKKRTCAGVHRLLALAFFGVSSREIHVHHKNGNKADNRLENLECLSIGEHTRIHLADPNRKRNTSSIYKIYRKRKLDRDKVSMILALLDAQVRVAEIAREFNVSESAVRRIKSGVAWKRLKCDRKISKPARCKKITDDQAREIFVLANSGTMSQKEIAQKFGIWQTAVSNIKTGRRRKKQTHKEK